MHEILKGIKVVIFDVMGVIISNPSLVKNGLYPLYKEKYSYDYVKGLYDDIKANPKGDYSLWRGLAERDHDAARERFLDTYELSEGFNEYREILKENNIKMSILSNMPKEWGEYFCKKFNLNEDFDPIVFSSNLGVSKPDYGKYIEFIQTKGGNSTQMLFIDDKLMNLKRASMVGMKSVHFDRGQDEGEIEFTPDFTITSFSDLM